MAGAVIVKGLDELRRDMPRLANRIKKEVRGVELAKLAEPVRVEAETFAIVDISHIGPQWSRMKIGVTARSVYIAPMMRRSRRGSSRPNLAPLLSRAMQDALDEKADTVVGAIESKIDFLSTEYGF